jgi:protein phosphatase
VITRALGPEGSVEVDTRSFRARAGDVYLLCSDGLTTMISEDVIRSILLADPALHDAGEALIAAANQAGGRDNITVVLLRLEDVGLGASISPDPEPVTMTGLPAVVSPEAPTPRSLARPRVAEPAVDGRGRGRLRLAGTLTALLLVLGLIAAGAYLALQSVYFIATNDRGLVTVYRGVPYTLPGNLALYSSDYVSGVSASTVPSERRQTLLDHSLRSEGSAASLVRSLELSELE